VVQTDFGGATTGSDYALAVALQADGSIVVAGHNGDVVRCTLARYTPSGSLDATFDGDGKLIAATVGGATCFDFTDVGVQQDGKIVASGSGANGFALARYNPDGTPDTGFGSGGGVSTPGTGSSQAQMIEPSGRIVLAGSGINGPVLAAYEGDPLPTPTSTPTPTPTATPTATPQSMTFSSLGAEDGRILESGETTDAGGTLSTTGLLRVGDDAAKRQYRSVLSFDTSPLPNTAVIVGVRLELKRQGVSGGGNPVQAFGGFLVDLREGNLGPTSGLELADFAAAADKTVGPLMPPLVEGWYSLLLTGGKHQINKVGRTQMRLRFVQDDNNDGVANRPRLVVEYVMP
jgi:uncharacterized delta-60 repeat protein